MTMKNPLPATRAASSLSLYASRLRLCGIVGPQRAKCLSDLANVRILELPAKGGKSAPKALASGGARR